MKELTVDTMDLLALILIWIGVLLIFMLDQVGCFLAGLGAGILIVRHK